jgi:hypothetical protein
MRHVIPPISYVVEKLRTSLDWSHIGHAELVENSAGVDVPGLPVCLVEVS